jgi:hypothetical protein
MSQTITLDLPDETVALYEKGAAAARKPLEEFLVDRLRQAVPVYAVDNEILTQKETPSLLRSEAQLLQQINVGFSKEEWIEYHALIAKRRTGTLLPDELQALIQFADRREQANAQRIQALVELAQLRQTSLDALMDELGIHTPGYE